jgi:hypothetical protein
MQRRKCEVNQKHASVLELNRIYLRKIKRPIMDSPSIIILTVEFKVYVPENLINQKGKQIMAKNCSMIGSPGTSRKNKSSIFVQERHELNSVK